MIGRHEDQSVGRINEPAGSALPAGAIEIGLEIAVPGRQLATKIAKDIATDDVTGPDPAQPAAMPAAGPGRLLGDIPVRQATGCAQCDDSLDKRPRLIKTHAASKVGQLVGRGLCRLGERGSNDSRVAEKRDEQQA